MNKTDEYSLYVHIPFCKARCGYCAFSSCTDFSLVESYFEKLFAEAERYSDKTRPIRTLYVGGGTPSSLSTCYIDALFCKLRDCFDMSRTCEINFECNPESTSDELLDCLADNGVTRLSFGLQSVNDATLKAIGRLHTYGEFLSALERALMRGFTDVNADLIIGLPEEQSQFIRSVKTVAELPLTHVSMYALELHPDAPLWKRFNGKSPASDDEMADMYDEALLILREKGFIRYEISNFAQAGRECKHNLNYWREGRYFALGASASGFVENVRFTNARDIRDYLSLPLERLRDGSCEEVTLAEQAKEFVMLGLRLVSGVSLSEFAERFGRAFCNYFPSAKRLNKLGLLLFDGDNVRVPDDKFYVSNSIVAELWSDVD